MKERNYKSTRLADRGLVIEGLRQTWQIGIIGIAACIFSKIIIEQKNLLQQAEVSFLDFFSLKPSLIIGIIVMILMEIRLFHFTSRRNAGDFYGALPRRNATIYGSYCIVSFVWLCALLLAWSVTGSLTEEAQEISFFHNMWKQAVLCVTYLLPVTGAAVLAFATTRTVINGVCITLIAGFVPYYLIMGYINGAVSLLPFVYWTDYIGSSAGVLQLLQEKVICALLSILGCIYIVAGGIIFRHQTMEPMNNSRARGIVRMIVRMVLLLAFCLHVDILLVPAVWQGRMTGDLYSRIGICIGCVLILWFVFELIMTRKIGKVLRSFWQLPVLLLLNVFVIGSYFGLMHTAGKVMPYNEVAKIEVRGVFWNTDQINDGFYDGTRKLYDMSEETRKVVYDVWQREMEKFSGDYAQYEEDVQHKEGVPVAFVTNEKKVVRVLQLEESDKKSIYDDYVRQARTVYGQNDIPKPEEVQSYSDCTSFAWDFNEQELKKLYTCYYKEVQHLNLPLCTYLGRRVNQQGVYDFLTVSNWNRMTQEPYYGMPVMDIPISIDTPKSVALLANMGNKKRIEYDLDIFCDYIDSIGNSDIGGTLQLILYKKGEQDIRYRRCGWWSDAEEDMTREELAQVQQIDKAHKEDTKVSADGNVLIIFYQDSDGVLPVTGHWYDVSDEEAQIIGDIIGDNSYFERYQYFKDRY